MTTKETIDKFAYIITPITILLGVFMFYKGFTNNYVETFNINYERIKTMIIFLCLITIFIIYYDKDPGGYIQKYFGYSLLLTIIISVFAFLYLIIVITLPDTNNSTKKDKSFSQQFLAHVDAIENLFDEVYAGHPNRNEAFEGLLITLIQVVCFLLRLQ
jgi:NhaP-type Na+/H+ or K+/H+ antiporter